MDCGASQSDSGKEYASNAGDVRDTDSIPGLGRSPEVGNGNPLQYSMGGYILCPWENPSGYSP